MGLKITKLEEKVTRNKETIAWLDDRVSSIEGKKVHLKTQDKLKATNLHDLEHYDRRESLSLV